MIEKIVELDLNLEPGNIEKNVSAMARLLLDVGKESGVPFSVFAMALIVILDAAHMKQQSAQTINDPMEDFDLFGLPR